MCIEWYENEVQEVQYGQNLCNFGMFFSGWNQFQVIQDYKVDYQDCQSNVVYLVFVMYGMNWVVIQSGQYKQDSNGVIYDYNVLEFCG